MTVKTIFETMEYGTAPESPAEALGWLAERDGRFGHFIDGAFTEPAPDFDSRNPASGAILARLSTATQADVDRAVNAARRAQPKWEAQGGHARAKVLYGLARLLQKHARLFAVLETLDNGKPIRESRDIDTALAQRHFYSVSYTHLTLPTSYAV